MSAAPTARRTNTTLDQLIIDRLRQQIANFYDQYKSHRHVNMMCTQLLQTTINDVFNQENQVMTLNLLDLVFGWLRGWIYGHYENLILYSKAVDYDTLSPMAKILNYQMFNASLWAIFLNVFIHGKIQFEVDENALYIVDTSSINSTLPSTIKRTDFEKLLKIPFERLSNNILLNILAIEQLHTVIFGTTELEAPRRHSHCKYNESLRFNGEVIVKHILLLMVSGLESATNLVGLSIYSQIKLIVKNLNPIRTGISTVNLPPIQTEDKMFWLWRLHNELMECDHQIQVNPKKLLNIIFHYCACKQSCKTSLTQKEQQCCNICHHQCQKWTTINNEGEVMTSFYSVLGLGTEIPNIIMQSANNGSNWSTLTCKINH